MHHWRCKPVDLAPATYGTFVRTSKLGALDGLRALSVLAVVWHHTSGEPGPRISQSGFLGVDFFFAISGFLITTLLLRERSKASKISLRKFYTRRALRIFPLYYVVLAVYVLLILATERETAKGERFFANLPAFLTYTVNWFVDLEHGQSVTFYFAWSLSTEEQFYLFWPPLLVLTLLLSKGKIWAPLLTLAVLVAVSVAFRLLTDPTVMPARVPASLSLPILLGAAAALVVSTPRGFVLTSFAFGRFWSAPLVFIVLFCSLWYGAPQWSIQTIMVCAVVAVSIKENTLLHPILRWRPLAFIGVISYGIYLMHMLCANIVRRIIDQDMSVTVFFGTVALVIVAAYVSFRLLETPILRLKRRFETIDERAGDELSRG